MKKITLVSFIIAILFAQQTLLPLAVMATTKSNDAMALSLKEVMATGDVLVYVESTHAEQLENVTIALPSHVQFDKNAQQIPEEIEWSYHAEQRTIVFSSIDQTHGKIPLIFDPVSEELFSLQAVGTVGQTTVQSNALTVTSPQTSLASIQQINENGSIARPNMELYVESLQETVLSGKVANFQLTFKVTGSETVYENVRLEVDLPQHASIPVSYPQVTTPELLNTLKINNELPVYDAQNKKLIYEFATLPSGQVYQTLIHVKPENGITPVSNQTDYNRHLQMKATAMRNDESISSTAQVQVLSDLEVVLTKKHLETKRLISGEYQTVNELARPGDYTTWEIKYAVPYKSSGLSFIAPNVSLALADMFSEAELQFDPSMQLEGFNGQYYSDGQIGTIVWALPTPTLEEQQAITSGNLLEGSFQVVLKVNEHLLETTESVTNMTSIGVPGLSAPGEEIVNFTNAFETIGIARIVNETDPLDKGYYPGFFGGAFDSLGNTQDVYYNFGLGTIPKVTDKALVANKIHYQVHPGGYEIYKDGALLEESAGYTETVIASGYKEFIAESTIDKKLNMTHLYLEMPYISYKSGTPDEGFPLTKIPTAYIQLKVNGQWQAKYVARFTEDETKLMLDLHEYGKPEGQHVEAYRIIYPDLSGKAFISAVAYFDVYEGAEGRATNTIRYDVTLNNGDAYSLIPFNDSNKDGNYRSANRHVDIVSSDELAPTVTTSIRFVDQDDSALLNSNLTLGTNRVAVQYENNASSATVVEGPIELVVALPPGVQFDSNLNFEADMLSQITTNLEPTTLPVSATYEALDIKDGQQYVKVTFDVPRLLAGERVSARFNVDVTNNAFSDVNMQVYGYSQSPTVLVPQENSNVLTATTIEVDGEDFNKNNNVLEQRVKSANNYKLVKYNNLQIKKEVKGEKDTAYTNFGYTLPGGQVDYRFTLTNTTGSDIETFTLIDVLPSVNDLGITDNVQRDSQFEVMLREPINFVDTKWNEKVTVYYSTSKNPTRDELYENVDFPTGSTQMPNPENAEQPNWMLESAVTDWSAIHSFKIVMKDGVDWLEGQDVVFEIFAQAEDVPFDSELLHQQIDETERAAWNSFAATANGLLPVEPLKVGVALQPKTGQLDVIKVDAETNALLEGTEFALYPLACKDDKNNYVRCDDAKPIATQMTDTNGETVFENIPYGFYELVETKSTAGYKLLTAPITVEIFSAQPIELTVENEKTTWVLPDTSGVGTMLYSLFGVAFMSMSLLVAARRKQPFNVN